MPAEGTETARGVDVSSVGRLLRRPWYGGWRLVERLLYQGREYTVQVPSGHRVYTPWFAPAGTSRFADLMAEVRRAGPVGASADRCHLLYQLGRWSLRVPGPWAECGVHRGGTAHLLALALAEGGGDRQLHLFDSFSGMPGEADPRRDYHRAGDFSDTSADAVRRRLGGHPSCRLHVGVIPATFAEVAGVEDYAFVHVDVDIHDTALECCRWFWPRLARGGVMVFDDYGFYPYRHAARAAVDGYFADQAVQPVVLPTGQAFVVNLP